MFSSLVHTYLFLFEVGSLSLLFTHELDCLRGKMHMINL